MLFALYERYRLAQWFELSSRRDVVKGAAGLDGVVANSAHTKTVGFQFIVVADVRTMAGMSRVFRSSASLWTDCIMRCRIIE